MFQETNETGNDHKVEFEMARNNSTQSESIELTKKTKYKKIKSKYNDKLGFLRNKLRIENQYIRTFLAEMLGTFIFVAFSFGGVAQYIFGKNITFLSVAVSFGFGLTMGIIVCGKVSGGHFNPAVSFAFVLLGRLSVVKFILYTIAQNLGAFLASAAVYLVYLHEFVIYPGGQHAIELSGIFGTLPRNITSSSDIETFSLFFDQYFATILFITIIIAICDDNNTPSNIPHTIKAVLIGMILMIIATAFGINSGFAVNPARDFGPRLFTLIAGWGTKVFTAGPYFFWIPIVAPMLAAPSAVIIYQLFIGNHLPDLDI